MVDKELEYCCEVSVWVGIACLMKDNLRQAEWTSSFMRARRTACVKGFCIRLSQHRAGSHEMALLHFRKSGSLPSILVRS